MVKRKGDALDTKNETREIAKSLLDQIQGHELYGYQQQFDELFNLVEQTVSSGGSNSVLILGPRGVGKKVMVNQVLKRVSTTSQVFRTDGLIVRLNGLVETDDRLALKEITRQLRLENVVGEKVFGGFAQHLEFLLASLKSDVTGRNSKPIVFILEEFGLFCNHRNQTLLYNLFDVAQSRAAPIIVIGISSSLDVVECLEKRVKSRFNHRQLAMLPHEKFEDYCLAVKHYLSIPANECRTDFQRDWNDHINTLLTAVDVKKTWSRVFATNSTIGFLKQYLYTVLSLLGEKKLTNLHLLQVLDEQSCPPERSLLTGLSVLEMCVLIAVKHVLLIYEDQPFNFEMAYHEYDKFATRKAKMFRYDRAVVMKAWEALQDLELITPLDRGTKVQKEYKLHQLQIPIDMIMTVVESGLPLSVKEWASSEIAE